MDIHQIDMILSKDQKALILKAYFDKSINKNEMEFLLSKGIIFPPLSWIDDNIEESEEEEKKRELSCRIYNIRFLPKIEWEVGDTSEL